MKAHQTTDRVFHIYNRGVDKRRIFLSEDDYNRFLLSMIAFNNTEVGYKRSIGRQLHTIDPGTNHHVEILCFCLMPNHYHLMLRELEPDGVSTFMQRLGTGYTNYFNNKLNRSGCLFQGKYKKKPITSHKYFQNIATYIHLNPVSLINPKNQESKQKVFNMLFQYPWSSLQDYFQSTSLFVNTAPIMKGFGTAREYRKFIIAWISKSIGKKNSVQIKNVASKAT